MTMRKTLWGLAGLYQSEIQLFAPEINNLVAQSVVLIPTPGPDKATLIVQIVGISAFGTTPFLNLGSQLGPFVLTREDSTAGTTVYTGTITGGDSNAFVNRYVAVSGFPTFGNNVPYAIITASTATTISVATTSQTTSEVHVASASGIATATADIVYDGPNTIYATGSFDLKSLILAPQNAAGNFIGGGTGIGIGANFPDVVNRSIILRNFMPTAHPGDPPWSTNFSAGDGSIKLAVLYTVIKV
ncbi:MAG TPA: hypothetical protein VN948_15005 [Terriglobales bacterium]|nr:hypothetical protein [Terriglobales bacterium]